MTIAERRMERMLGSVAHVFDWFRDGPFERHRADPGIADFTFGNPQELPLPGLVDALQRHAVPQDKDWFAYKFSEPEPRRVVAESLRRRTGIAFRPEDIALTAGAFGALGVTIRALCDVDDEVIFLSPPWFFYELMIVSSGATPVRVRLAGTGLRPRPRRDRRGHHAAHPGDHRQQPQQPDGPDLPRTRAGRARPGPGGSLGASRPADRAHLGRGLQPDRLRRHRVPQPGARLRRHDDDLHLRQDAAGARPADRLRGDVAGLPRPRVDGLPDHGPAAGRGLGLPERPPAARRSPTSRTLSIDIGALQARRDRMVPALTEMGYEVTRPEGTFYAMVRSPDPDDVAFTARLAELGALVLPGVDRRVARLVPPLAHGQRRDGRTRPRGVPARPRLRYWAYGQVHPQQAGGRQHQAAHRGPPVRARQRLGRGPAERRGRERATSPSTPGTSTRRGISA